MSLKINIESIFSPNSYKVYVNKDYATVYMWGCCEEEGGCGCVSHIDNKDLLIKYKKDILTYSKIKLRFRSREGDKLDKMLNDAYYDIEHKISVDENY